MSGRKKRMNLSPSEKANIYTKEHYDRVLVLLPKGTKDRLKDHALTNGNGSVNNFIRRAIFEKIERDASK